jgi:hypothetical protein
MPKTVTVRVLPIFMPAGGVTATTHVLTVRRRMGGPTVSNADGSDETVGGDIADACDRWARDRGMMVARGRK